MPYIKKHYDNTNCAAPYSATKATFNVTNMNGAVSGFAHYISGSQNIKKAVCDLLTEANIPYTDVSEFEIEVWGVKFAILQLTSGCNGSSGYNYGTWMATIIPSGNCQYPLNSNTAGRGSGGATLGRYGVSAAYCCWWNASDGNKVGFDAYLYYSDNYIFFRLRENENVGAYSTPFFYLFKGKTIDGHNCAMLGGSPSANSNITTAADGYSNEATFGYRHEFFDLDNIAHTEGTAYRTAAVVLSPYVNANIGTYGNDYLVDDVVLKPLSDWCMNGYALFDNIYYIDYFIWERDMLEDRIIEVNGEQYYIPRRQVLMTANTYKGLASSHPIALKL